MLQTKTATMRTFRFWHTWCRWSSYSPNTICAVSSILHSCWFCKFGMFVLNTLGEKMSTSVRYFWIVHIVVCVASFNYVIAYTLRKFTVETDFDWKESNDSILHGINWTLEDIRAILSHFGSSMTFDPLKTLKRLCRIFCVEWNCSCFSWASGVKPVTFM